MTVGTAIVLCFGIVAATWLATLGIGALVLKQKNKAKNELTQSIAEKIREARDKK